MLERPRLDRRLAARLPAFLRRRLMVVETAIDASLAEFAEETAAGSRILDAGAGEGAHASFFRHCRYTSVDLGVGDTSWDYSDLSAKANLVALPFEDGAFDAAVNIVVLEHTPEPARVLKEIARVLRPGGRLLLVAPQMWEVHQAPHDYYRFTRYGLARLLAEAALSDPIIRPIGGYFTLLGRRTLNGLRFFQNGWRWLLFPFAAAAAGTSALILPLFDSLDTSKDFTLAYVCFAHKR